ncbi:hypothetical protein K7X08_028900 [Anisodus acutangulus]|uniref:Exocyst complex subunit EXOC6/Sec15 C-terminal domain-containing protein n=1 Tax=Anisodus acutangulus TaxID=402998 RepID=A0A9Q1L1Y8_9SOLA|nr:hypothetical protein K7X08_028900 [Anisodus acutangulus]
MCSVLEDQFPGMQTANHLLLIKDYVSFLGVTLHRYGYHVEALLDFLSKHRDKYHELLLSDCQKQITKALTVDKFEKMYMKKEYDYSMNVLSFLLQTSNIMHVSFMSHGGQLDFYDVVKKYLDLLLTEILDGTQLKLINTSIGGVTQAMQMVANMAMFECSCDLFFHHDAHLSGIPLRMVERERRLFALTKVCDAAEEMISGLLKQKVDGFLLLIENVN